LGKKRSAAIGKGRERLSIVRSGGDPITSDPFKGIETILTGNVILPERIVKEPNGTISVIPDGNRGAILPDHKIEWKGREYLLSVKGVGARRPMYDHITDGIGSPDEYPFTSESFFGENPWGAMSKRACQDDKLITESAEGSSINGFHICPMHSAEPLPEEIMARARSTFWYRQFPDPGPFYQQIRLVPSDVRLFYQSSSTLGDNVRTVMEAFGVSNVNDLDDMISNYIRSGIAALTLSVRTLKKEGHRFSILDYFDVWLDKDSVLAPDGTLFFADIEGLDRAYYHDVDDLVKKIKAQYQRNFYEFMFGLDRLIRYREDLKGKELSWPARRAGLGAMFEMSLSDDPYLDIFEKSGALFLKPLIEFDVPTIELKVIDTEGN
jgi:hypothetical protein